jgi:hypothetical protein
VAVPTQTEKLSRKLQSANLFKDPSKIGVWSNALGSVRIQEGEPMANPHIDFADFFAGIVKPDAKFDSFCSGFALTFSIAARASRC